MGGQFSVQLIGVGVGVLFTAVGTYLILKLVGVLAGGLRVTDEQEVEGLDTVSHEESAYND
jgi:Amt family ammonium transporter